MPHVVVEYTDNLRGSIDVPALLADVNASLVAARGDDGAPVFPVGGIRSRAIALADWCIGDGSGVDDAFVHVTVKIGRGRDAALRARVFDALFAVITARLAPLFDARGFALSMDVAEFGEAGTWKKNNLHARPPRPSRA